MTQDKEEGEMTKSSMVLVVLVCVFALGLAGCHGKKAKPAIPPEEAGKPPVGEVIKEPGIGEPSEKPVTPIEPSEAARAALKDIHFEYDKYNLTDEAADAMARNAEYLMNHTDINVLIEGHCDERGTEEYNLALGEKRAIAARDFLVRFGIQRSRISIISYGEERPLDPAGDELAWSKNRRAHFEVK
jgi:peptidoglycan-associated lipoprotein